MLRASNLISKVQSILFDDRVHSVISAVYPYLVIFTYSLIIIEMITYPGFIRNYLYISSKLFVVGTLTTGVYVVSGKNKRSELLKIALNLSNLLLPVVSFIYIVLISEEESHFPNYIFSTYGVHISQFYYLFLFNIGLVFLFFAHSQRKKIVGVFTQRYKHLASTLNTIELYIVAVALALVVWILLHNITTIFINSLESFPYIVQHPTATYQEKQARRITVYPYLKFVVDHSPEDAVIAIPPQMNPWLTVGNGGYIRYFLYPRREINVDLGEDIPEAANYILIARGTWAASDPSLYGWPKQYIPAETIWSFDMKTHEVREYNNVDFNPELSTIEWGLIKRK